MDKNKKLQKIPEYSVDKIISKSDLATRGLRELGLLKNKKHYTIIYACQFCGRLVNFTSTPCIFCGKWPKTKKEIVVAQALSSESLNINDQLHVSALIKGGKDLEIEVHDLRDLIDRVVENWESYPIYNTLFSIAEDSVSRYNDAQEIIQGRISLTRAQCQNCGKNVQSAVLDGCLSCKSDLNFSKLQKVTLAINQILIFVETYLDAGEDEESLEELIFVLVYSITRAVEKEECPDRVLLNYISELLHKSHYLISYKLGVGVEIKNGEASRIGGLGEENLSKEEMISVLLASNVDYLLQQLAH